MGFLLISTNMFFLGIFPENYWISLAILILSCNLMFIDLFMFLMEGLNNTMNWKKKRIFEAAEDITKRRKKFVRKQNGRQRVIDRLKNLNMSKVGAGKTILGTNVRPRKGSEMSEAKDSES